MSDSDDLSTETSVESNRGDTRAVKVTLTDELLAALDDQLEYHHSRSEYVRDAIRERLRRE
jgi:metal-responsive CopG/Arc/MetJ family transcriptional regulator